MSEGVGEVEERIRHGVLIGFCDGSGISWSCDSVANYLATLVVVNKVTQSTNNALV